MPKRLSAGGRPIGGVVPRVKRKVKTPPVLEADADQLRIKLEIDNKYAGKPDTGRVIPKGSEEFERIAAELLARENKVLGVLDMGTKGKTCDVTDCTTMDWRNGKCWKHHPINVAKREQKEAVAPDPVVVAAMVAAPAPAVSVDKPNWRICSVPGCEHFVTRQRLCWSHLKARGIDPKSGKALVVEAHVENLPPAGVSPLAEARTLLDACLQDWTDDTPSNFANIVAANVSGPGIFGMVANDAAAPASFDTDPVILLALREAWAAKEADWLTELSGLKPGKAVCFAAKMVEAVEGLGY